MASKKNNKPAPHGGQRKQPLSARALKVIFGALIAIGLAIWTGALGWITDQTKSGLDELWSRTFADETERNIEVAFTLDPHFPHCQTGSLAYQLRMVPSLKFANGADNLLICADYRAKGRTDDMFGFLQDIEARFPGCIKVSGDAKQPTISPNLDAGSVCRAPYRLQGSNLSNTRAAQGMLICLPGQSMPPPLTECREDDLRNFGFL